MNTHRIETLLCLVAAGIALAGTLAVAATVNGMRPVGEPSSPVPYAFTEGMVGALGAANRHRTHWPYAHTEGMLGTGTGSTKVAGR